MHAGRVLLQQGSLGPCRLACHCSLMGEATLAITTRRSVCEQSAMQEDCAHTLGANGGLPAAVLGRLDRRAAAASRPHTHHGEATPAGRSGDRRHGHNDLAIQRALHCRPRSTSGQRRRHFSCALLWACGGEFMASKRGLSAGKWCSCRLPQERGERERGQRWPATRGWRLMDLHAMHFANCACAG